MNAGSRGFQPDGFAVFTARKRLQSYPLLLSQIAPVRFRIGLRHPRSDGTPGDFRRTQAARPAVTRRVVDASVAAKWVLPEEHSPAALRLLDPVYSLAASDLVYAETANVLWKRVKRGELAPGEARVALETLIGFPLDVHPARTLIESALVIALRTARTFYVSLDLALAIAYGHPLVTADERLFNSLQVTPLAERVLWIEDPGI